MYAMCDSIVVQWRGQGGVPWSSGISIFLLKPWLHYHRKRTGNIFFFFSFYHMITWVTGITYLIAYLHDFHAISFKIEASHNELQVSYWKNHYLKNQLTRHIWRFKNLQWYLFKIIYIFFLSEWIGMYNLQTHVVTFSFKN